MGDLVKLEMWVPAALIDEAREAVQDVIDAANRPLPPVPSWAAPMVSAVSQANSAMRAAEAQNRAVAMMAKPDDPP